MAGHLPPHVAFMPNVLKNNNTESISAAFVGRRACVFFYIANSGSYQETERLLHNVVNIVVDTGVTRLSIYLPTQGSWIQLLVVANQVNFSLLRSTQFIL